MTLVALFAMTAGAWADGQSESFTTATNGQLTYTGEHFTISGQKADTDGLWIGNAGGSDYTVTISSRNGENITKIEAVLSYEQNWGDTKLATTSGEVTGTYVIGQTITISSVNATTVTLSGPEGEFKLIEFKSWTIYYGDTPAPAGTALTSTDGKVWTLDAMPAGNVELQVAYFPGMLVKPTSLVGGTMEIEGVSDTALPDGFEKDDAGNIYVEAGKTFTVKAVPAEGYHLVGWSDDATIKDLEREFTMPADGSDFTVTATFSDEFELTFDDVNFKTNQNITVKVGDADKTLDGKDGKLSVKAGQTVTLTAKQGYKFRSVEAKKGGALKTVSVAGPYGDNTFYYVEGESWQKAITNHPTENAGWSVWGSPAKVWKGEGKLESKSGDDWNLTIPDAVISSSTQYRLNYE